ncbi:hypothetical protein [Dactylosporangium sp. NPDC000521]|uniref:hypothetical protein n=1 Tax=Dactylosporangium sp. NPDC000521 TaxID=3363975 RepID=UPI0036C7EF69
MADAAGADRLDEPGGSTVREAVGPRAVFGVIVPSTNTVVEHDYWSARVPGVAYRAGSMHIPNPAMNDDAGFEALLGQIRASIDTAVRDVLTAEPDRMVMGMSAETFWGGVEGKPVVAINAATLWHALRCHGLTDQLPSAGSLFRAH